MTSTTSLVILSSLPESMGMWNMFCWVWLVVSGPTPCSRDPVVVIVVLLLELNGVKLRVTNISVFGHRMLML